MLPKISLTLKKTYVILFLGLFAGICITQLFKCNDKTAISTAVVPIKDLKAAADKNQNDFLERTTALQLHTDSLTRKLADTKTLLTAAKQKAITAEDKVKQLAASFQDKPTLVTGDSLATGVGEYIAQNSTKDSLLTAQIVTQDSLLSSKDTVIALQEKRYLKLHSIFDQSLVSQEALQLQNKSLTKDLKRARAKNKWLTLGLIIGSGLAAGYLIQH